METKRQKQNQSLILLIQLFSFFIFLFSVNVTSADEGLWTFDNLPLQTMLQRYHAAPNAEWIRKVQLASLRFNDGGSGSFVSANGLVLTNHHVALGQLQKVSTSTQDYVKNGFYARTRQQELKCPDLEINQLISMENVTKRVKSVIHSNVSEKEQNKARKAEIARIESESTKQTGLRSDVIELYQGGEYWLYRYKKYTDIRLVMAPEAQAAQFGGDPDNFTYPRYALDYAFFRIYEQGKPIHPTYYFKWSKTGLKEGELVFVSGHPGHTYRLDTLAQLEFQRDYPLPVQLAYMKQLHDELMNYSAQSTEKARRAFGLIQRIENRMKAYKGMLAGLQNTSLMVQKESEENELKNKVIQNKNLTKYADAWSHLATAMQEYAKNYKTYVYRNITGTTDPDPVNESRLTFLAGNIVRYVYEIQKPNEKRYEEFRDSALQSTRLQLLSPAPIYPDFEQLRLTNALNTSLKQLGANDIFIKIALNGQTPEVVAEKLVSETKLFDPLVRKQLLDGGIKAVNASKDPLIVWARKLDPIIRKLRSWHEDDIESVETIEGAKIANARFDIYGKSTYPDATFTLRLSYGKVAGYEEYGQHIPYQTEFKGLYERANQFAYKPPYNLAEKVKAKQQAIGLSTPLNFVATNDVIGGNSGSPVLNISAELVGLIFDGNIQSLSWDYVYNDVQARSIAVSSIAILASLRKVYDMNGLADELIHS